MTSVLKIGRRHFECMASYSCRCYWSAEVLLSETIEQPTVSYATRGSGLTVKYSTHHLNIKPHHTQDKMKNDVGLSFG